MRRPEPDFSIEQALWLEGHTAVAGVDEAGRGCLAGPVVAAAVVFSPTDDVGGLADSKILAPEVRETLAAEICHRALGVGVGQCTPREIDRWNILNASLEAMRRAVASLPVPASFVLVDGNRMWPRPGCPWKTVVGGDGRSRSIAAASIVAKVERDAMMVRLAGEHPEYGWSSNKGYPTPDHFVALGRHGPTVHHRRSFRLRLETPDRADLFGSGRT